MKKLLFGLSTLALLSACSSNNKRLIVMSKGAADVNTDTRTITAKDGAGHDEKTIDIAGQKLSFQLSSPAGNSSVDITDNGLYVINVKNDTIVGGYQPYADPKTLKQVFSQDDVKKRIDSLVQVTEGKNISAANRNFFLLPNTATKISANIDAIVVGPYHKMTSAEKVGDKDPEVYRFFSIKEVREEIARLQAMTVPVKK
ncbi:MAG: membrane lipoprotein lipid attachment site-containing protein [Sediminibacterium magnilacihabitans]|jgi:hypothetical protein|nr:membrane lipoprotein lipid attachment site-containing protein [Sediminibacterium magnilacihabitans]PQV59819.1 hypothetical protein CLV53_11345 [Sediminibacterium magnilacihabitans]